MDTDAHAGRAARGRASTRAWAWIRGLAVLVLGLSLVVAGDPAGADPDAGPPGAASGEGGPVVGAQQEVDVTPARIDGEDRFDTAAITADITFDTAVTTAVVARGDAFPDALAGAAASGAVGGPVLLVESDTVPAETRQALDALTVDRVVIVGGTGAVGAGVEEDLAASFDVDRVAGADRYGTAAEVARQVAASAGIGEWDGDRTAILASGETFPDALTSGPLAFHASIPILLTPRDDLASATREVLEDLGIERVLIVGGTAAVSSAVESRVGTMGLATQRIGGANRAATAALFADELIETWQFSADRPMLARGDAFPDALAAAPRGGAIESPVLLSLDPDTLGEATGEWLAARCPAVDAVQAVGGTAAVAIGTLDGAVAAAESCGDQPPADPARTITYETGVLGAVEGTRDALRLRARQALTDPRGWALGDDIAYVEVADGADFRLWLASPQVVADAAPVCSAEWSCRVGDDVYINDVRFREATATYARRSLTSYQWYVINHEVGHWLGVDHYDCPGAGQAAPVMQQQSIALEGCTTNVWPLAFELDIVRARWLP